MTAIPMRNGFIVETPLHDCPGEVGRDDFFGGFGALGVQVKQVRQPSKGVCVVWAG